MTISNEPSVVDGGGVALNGNKSKDSTKKYKIEIVWRNIFLLTILHISAVWGLYLYLFHAHPYTIFFNNVLIIFLAMGITAGAHRLWSHKSYEANVPLRIFLMILNCGMMQNSLYEWVRDHRVHHAYSETDADPHNSRRGFFFAHMGWLLCKKHPDVFEKGARVSCQDLLQDKIVVFQEQFYKPLAVFFTLYLPSVIPYYLWGENVYTSLFISTLRYTITLHGTWLVNSAAHMYGMRPYDTGINPVESTLVKYSSIGEGFHNFHHVFPYAYSASELGWMYDLNVTTLFIDFFHKIGWATNLKSVDPKIIENRIKRTGDLELAKAYAARKEKFNWDTLFVLFGVFVLIPCLVIGLRKLVFWIF